MKLRIRLRTQEMTTSCSAEDCATCPGKMICRCLQVTEDQIVDALTRLSLRTLGDIKQCTGAGGGCMACHRTIKGYIARYSPSSCPPICSVK
jgi:bacterioferritin-associated ferredoxin